MNLEIVLWSLVEGRSASAQLQRRFRPGDASTRQRHRERSDWGVFFGSIPSYLNFFRVGVLFGSTG